MGGILVTFTILIIIGAVLEVSFFSDGHAQRLHDRTIYVITNQTSRWSNISQIPVGDDPEAIGVNPDTNTVYVANKGSDSVSVIFGNNDTKMSEDIPVGSGPEGIGIEPYTNTVYVANRNNDSVSVINGKNNSKMGEDIPVGYGSDPDAIEVDNRNVYVVNYGSDSVSVIDQDSKTVMGEDIFVGERPLGIAGQFVTNYGSDSVSWIFPDNKSQIEVINDTIVDRPIAIDFDANGTMYVANTNSKNVSVISPKNFTEIHEDIPVGERPIAIGVDDVTNTVYVVNGGSDSVSVIYGNNKTKMEEDIPVGDEPSDIAVNSDTGAVYVANSGNDSISIIDGISNKVVAGVKFNVYPFNSGYVECDKLASPTAQYIYVWSGTECKAKANDGFEFYNWIKNLDQNSSTIIKQVPVSTNPLKPIFDLFTNESEKNEAASLNIAEFGTFTANFKEVPSPIPKEIWLSLFAISLSVIIPSILKWYIGRRQRREFYDYIQQIPSKYNMKLDMKTLNDEISELYAKGKINESQQKILNEKVSTYFNNSSKI